MSQREEIAVYGLLVVLAVACTPAETQVAAKDGSKIAADFATCVKAQANLPGATPGGVATTCGVEEIPDALALIADEIAAARKGDAGADASP